MAQKMGTPTLTPPGVRTGEGDDRAPGTTKPTITDAGSAGVTTAAPRTPVGRPRESMSASTAQSAGAITGTWTSGAIVDAMWSADEVRNAWMHVVGTGWKKLFNGTDGAFVALTTLASQARQTGRSVNYREESDGMVYEIYLW